MKIKIKCSKLVKLNENLKKAFNKNNFEEYNKVAEKMEKLEEIIKELYSKVEYINTLVYPIVVDVEVNDKWVWKEGGSEEVQFKKLYNKTKFLYKTMEKKVDYAIDFIERQRK